MMRTNIVAAALPLVLLHAAVGRDSTAKQRAACKNDSDTLCTGTIPDRGRVPACLNS